MGNVAFVTLSQAVLFQFELKGQLQNGLFSEMEPKGHHEPWCAAQVLVNHLDPGRDFIAHDDYDLEKIPSLVDEIGGRMLVQVRLASTFGLRFLPVLLHLFDLKGRYTGIPTGPGPYLDSVRIELLHLMNAGLVLDRVRNAASTADYCIPELLEDLDTIFGIMKCFRKTEPKKPIVERLNEA